MNPFERLDAALLALARKFVNVWSRATGKTNFALAYFIFAVALGGLFGSVLFAFFYKGSFWGTWIGVYFAVHSLVVFLAMVALRYVAHKQWQREFSSEEALDYRTEASLSQFSVYLALKGLIILAMLAAVVSYSDQKTAGFLFFLFSLQCWVNLIAALYFSRCFDKGGKSKVVAWVKAAAQKARALDAKPEAVPVPIPIPN